MLEKLRISIDFIRANNLLRNLCCKYLEDDLWYNTFLIFQHV